MKVRSARRPGETVASYSSLVDRLCPPYPLDLDGSDAAVTPEPPAEG